jgi:hypothetical protein
MPVSLKGLPELNGRLRAIQDSPDAIRRDWQEKTAEHARNRMPARTGATQRSIKPAGRRGRRVAVTGNAPVNFIDSGVRAHDIVARGRALRITTPSGTFFRRKVHKVAQPPRPFKAEAGRAALRSGLLNNVIRLWNSGDTPFAGIVSQVRQFL